MKLKDLGEFGLIGQIAKLFRYDLPAGTEGIGDDCAILPYVDGNSLLVSTDLLIEDTHFIKAKIHPKELGYKSLAVNLSDIAAMGGSPLYAFLSIGLPIDTSVEWIEEFLLGFKELSEQSKTYLLGGDTTRSGKIVINVVVMGSVKTEQVKRRSQALPGDIICCTGFLGDSGAGLKILLEEIPLNIDSKILIDAHLHPRPHLQEGAWLAAHAGVHAMMDISDGLASDITHIMEQSKAGAHIEVDKLPMSESLTRSAKTWGWSAEELALTSGEDYCLLVTVDPADFENIQKAFQEQFHRPLYPVGTILQKQILQYTYQNQPFEFNHGGYDHFKKSLA